jgi:hypothetical protein
LRMNRSRFPGTNIHERSCLALARCMSNPGDGA